MPSPGSRPSPLQRFLRDLGLAFIGCFLTLAFLLQPFKVEGSSMLPALLDQERILVNKWVYDSETIKRGDIIVFQPPDRPDKSFIKRVIGVPGDIISIRGDEVLINGRVDALLASARTGTTPGFGPHTIGKGRYFVLGDHRSVSSDSRHWGLVRHESIHGKAVLRYWPPHSFGLLP